MRFPEIRLLTKMSRIFKIRSENTSTYRSLSFITMLGRGFAMFPVKGLGKANVRNLRFKWISWVMLYSLFYLAAIIFILTFYILKWIVKKKLNFGDFVSIVFFSCALICTTLFIRLGRKWPTLMLYWTTIDIKLKDFEFNCNLSARLKIMSIVVLTAALLEHILYLSSAISGTQAEGSEKFIEFLKVNSDQFFNFITFAVWKGVLFLILNFMCTFTWNYMDLFVMVISTAVAQKFKAINHQLKLGLISKSKDFAFWNKLRENYITVSNLCRTVDDYVSDIILLSFGNNVFFILIQLYHSLNRPSFDNVMGRLYFTYSFMFLICRAVAVLLYASSINETSRETAILLLSTPASIYNVAIERFLYKIHVDLPALTGKRFFRVTRPLILNIASAIVTYELVLLQFHVVNS